MEEIENRFEIIRIAVILSDDETVAIQIRRLRNLSTDKRLHAILDDLERRNFRQALYAMQDYAQSLRDTFFDPGEEISGAQTGSSATSRTAEPTPAAVGDDLFAASLASAEEEETVREIGLDDMLEMTRESATEPRTYTEPPEAVRPDEDTMPAEVSTLDTSAASPEPTVSDDTPPIDDPLFSLDQLPETDEVSSAAVRTHTEEAPQETTTPVSASTGGADDPVSDTLFALDESDEEDRTVLSDTPEEASVMTEEEMSAPTEAPPLQTPSAATPSEPTEMTREEGLFGGAVEEPVSASPLSAEHTSTAPGSEAAVPAASVSGDESSDASSEETAGSVRPVSVGESSRSEAALHTYPWEDEPLDDDRVYEKFPYMRQKFRNMLHKYPQVQPCEQGISPEAEHFIEMVQTRDYTETQVEAAIKRYETLKNEGRLAEAAQILIAAATTESIFAQFMLARELFKGDVLVQDYPEAFTQINRLAEEDYPEAICDLGQLYEYGIGIDKNKHHALLLYEEAAQMGIERARRHYERLKNTNPIQSIKSLTTGLLSKIKR
jgi:hypothetical protein